jgi:hypothetical protein
VAQLVNLPDFKSIPLADRPVDRAESRAFASIPGATPTVVATVKPALDSRSEAPSRPILCVVDWQKQPDDAFAPSIAIALPEPTPAARIERRSSGEGTVQSTATLSAIESAIDEYQQRHFADPANFAVFRQRHGESLAKPFEIAADAVIAVDWGR